MWLCRTRIFIEIEISGVLHAPLKDVKTDYVGGSLMLRLRYWGSAKTTIQIIKNYYSDIKLQRIDQKGSQGTSLVNADEIELELSASTSVYYSPVRGSMAPTKSETI